MKTKYLFIPISILLIASLVIVFSESIIFSSDPTINQLIKSIILYIPLVLFGLLTTFLYHNSFRIFKELRKPIYILLGLIIAINNFPFISYFNHNSFFINPSFLGITLLIISLILSTFFEELIFRGIILSFFLSKFKKNKKGLFISLLLSSIIFGLFHFINIGDLGFVETIKQVGYSILTGFLFGFLYYRTHNILISSSVHFLYNLSGSILLYFGTGTVFDTYTIIQMVAVSLIIGVIILFDIFKQKYEQFY